MPWSPGPRAAQAADPHVAAKSGGIYASWMLSDEYGFIDMDGNRPHWGRHYEAYLAQQQAQA